MNHVYPLDDGFAHVTSGIDCPCDPDLKTLCPNCDGSKEGCYLCDGGLVAAAIPQEADLVVHKIVATVEMAKPAPIPVCPSGDDEAETPQTTDPGPPVS